MVKTASHEQGWCKCMGGECKNQIENIKHNATTRKEDGGATLIATIKKRMQSVRLDSHSLLTAPAVVNAHDARTQAYTRVERDSETARMRDRQSMCRL